MTPLQLLDAKKCPDSDPSNLTRLGIDSESRSRKAQNKPYFERAFAVANKINPDRLAKSGKKPKFKTVNDKLVLSDGTRSVELHHIHGSVHTDTFLMAYLPKEKLLIEADAFTPGPPNSPPPAQANPYHVNLVENIERLKLSVDRILPLHGRIASVADLYTAARARCPNRNRPGPDGLAV